MAWVQLMRSGEECLRAAVHGGHLQQIAADVVFVRLFVADLTRRQLTMPQSCSTLKLAVKKWPGMCYSSWRSKSGRVATEIASTQHPLAAHALPIGLAVAAEWDLFNWQDLSAHGQ